MSISLEQEPQFFPLDEAWRWNLKVNGNYNLTSPLDAVCWHTGGFCVTGPQLVTMAITDAPGGGQRFTIVSASITTTFTLPQTLPDAAVPEPGTLAMLGAGLLALGWRRKAGCAVPNGTEVLRVGAFWLR